MDVVEYSNTSVYPFRLISSTFSNIIRPLIPMKSSSTLIRGDECDGNIPLWTNYCKVRDFGRFFRIESHGVLMSLKGGPPPAAAIRHCPKMAVHIMECLSKIQITQFAS